MPASSPRFLYFDLGNVLLMFDHEIAVRQMAEVMDRPRDEIRRLVFEGDLQTRCETGLATSRSFCEELSRLTESRPDFNRLQWAASAIFALNPSMPPLLAALKSAGYRLGILSNTCDFHWNYIRRRRYAMIEHLFEIHALSFELGAMKPAPAIYQSAAEIAGHAPAEIFFVDDRPDNVQGAQFAGLDAILFTTPRDVQRQLRQRGLHFNY